MFDMRLSGTKPSGTKVSTMTRLLAAVFAIGTLAGCSGSSPAPADATPLVGEDCPDLVAGGTQVRFADAQGSQLTGVVLGKGSAGVVLSHMSDGNVCDWLTYARQLAKGGYQAIVFYFHGFGTSGGGANGSTLDGDVSAAAGYLRSHGARTIALVGASLGATASVVAASRLQPAPAVVVSLSAPKYYQGLDAMEAAGKLTVPVLYAAGQGDVEFADAAQALYDATPKTTKRSLLVVPSTAHGTGLVGGPGSQLRDAMDQELKDEAPASG
jgi:pimeloyl-ACP methyl ester carboxylesterase